MAPLEEPRITREPLYKQVAERIEDRILLGQYVDGSALPNEYELSQEYGVSIGTVRAAIQILVDKKLLLRHQGRGTFVSDRRLIEAAERLVKIRFGADAAVGDWRYRELEYAIVEANEQLATDLGVEVGLQLHYFRRLRSATGRPDEFLETGYSPANIFSDFKMDLIGRRDAASIARTQGILFGPIERRISAVGASQEVASLLEIESGTPLLRIHRRLFDSEQNLIEFREMLFVAKEGYYRDYDE